MNVFVQQEELPISKVCVCKVNCAGCGVQGFNWVPLLLDPP